MIQIQKIREELKVNSKAEKEIHEKSGENLNSNKFHELNSARMIKDICKSCPESKYHRDFNTLRCIHCAKEAYFKETTKVVRV